MSTLFDRTIAQSYTELLKTASTSGVTSDLTIIEDGDATASALLLSSTAVKSSGTLEVVGPTNLLSGLSVSGASNLTGNVSMGGDLLVAGNAVIQGTLTANGGTLTLGDADTDNVVFNADINSHILPNTDNTYDLGSATKSWRDLHIDGTATLNNLSITGSQTVSATTQSTNKDTGALVVEGGVGVEKNANIGGTFGVIGSTTLSNTLGVSGATTLSSTLGVSDTISATKATGIGLAVTNNATIGGTLGVTGASTLTGNASVGGTLGVTGDVAVNTNKFTVTAANGNTSVAGTLGVTSATSLSSTLSVTGDTTLTGNLTANANTTLGDANTDTVTFNARAASNLVPATDDTHDLGSSVLEWKDLYVDGTARVDTLTVDESATVAGNLTVTGDLTINGTTTTLNTENLVVEDKNVILGQITTPTDVTANGGGITLKGASDKTLNWVSSNAAWTSSENFDVATGKTYKVNGTDVLSNNTLGSGVTASSLTSVGTIAAGTWQGTIINPTYGGTGVNNGSKTITLGGNLTTSGAFATTLASTADTNVTLPTTGTLATLANTETFTNKTLTSPVISSIVNTGTLTLPTSNDTLVGRATTDTLTNKTLTSPTINNGSLNMGSGTLVLPNASTPAQTASGSLVWNSASSLLTVGDGTARKTLVDIDSTQTLSNKTIVVSPTITLGNHLSGSLTLTNLAGGTLSATLADNVTNQKVQVSRNGSAAIGTRKRINFNEGTNVTIVVSDDPTNDCVNVSVTSSGGGGGGTGGTTVAGADLREVWLYS